MCFFFKQKTAYELRISDWSSDVCSSDLGADRILVIGVRDETADTVTSPADPDKYPSFAQITGYMLDTLLMEGLYSDLERMTRINQKIGRASCRERVCQYV